MSAAGTGGGKLRRGGPPASAVSCWAEPVDGRDGQRQIAGGGRAGAAVRRSRFRRYDPVRRGSRARGRDLRGTRSGAGAGCAGAGWIRHRRRRSADRTRDPGGWEVARVFGQPAGSGFAKELAPHLGDIHGQHDQQLLFSAEAQRDMLDAFAENAESVDRVAGLYRQWHATAAELEEVERTEQEKLRLLDLWSFQRKEIESAALEPEEETSLENERRVLQNVRRLQES